MKIIWRKGVFWKIEILFIYMIKLYTEDEFNTATSREKLKLECEHCHQPFMATKKDIQWALKCSYRNILRYCSKKCKGKNEDTKVEFKCKMCDKVIKKRIKEVIRHNCKYTFCSHSCNAKYWNVNKTWGSNRSKLELWLEQQLILLYPSLEILYNDRKTINAELDIYIPSLKLAFELNGIFHYEPIYGDDKLKTTMGNDNRKIFACAEQNIELCIIDTHNTKYFKEKSSKIFLDIITNIIGEKIGRS